MNRSGKKRLMALACITIVSITSVLTAGAETLDVADKASLNPEARSVNRTFTLDFEESTAWYTVGFSNSALGFNHNNVSLVYESYESSGTVDENDVYVQVDLYIDSDGDGDYERYATDGSYVQDLPYGGTIQYRLPYGRDPYDYRLKITNMNTKVTSGTFHLKSFYNLP